MFSLALSTCLVAAVYSAAVAPEVKEAPAAAHYGVPAPSYSNGPVYNFPNFDVNYCSVHASFPLIGLDRHHRHHRRNHHDRVKRQSYGVPPQQDGPSGSYPSFDAPSYGPSYFQRPRPFDRQGCRNTAIFDHKSCNRCCQIASRSAGTDAGAIGLLMAFDPKTIDGRRHNKDDKINDADRAVQCVCCTSRRV